MTSYLTKKADQSEASIGLHSVISIPLVQLSDSDIEKIRKEVVLLKIEVLRMLQNHLSVSLYHFQLKSTKKRPANFGKSGENEGKRRKISKVSKLL